MVRQTLRGRARRARGTVTVVVLLALVATGFAGSSPSSAADHHGLHHRKHNLDTSINSQRADLGEISTRLLGAATRLDSAVRDLADARGRLADIRAQVRAATSLDKLMQARLEQAIVRLHNARSDVRSGRVDVVAKRSELTGYAVSSYQTGGLDVYSLGMAFDSRSAQQTVDSLQDVNTALNKQTVALQQLQAMQVLLTLTEKRLRTTRADVSRRRQDAAANLALKRTLERQAETAKTDVKTHVLSLRADRRQLASAKRDEVRRLHTLQAERKRVEVRLRQVAQRRARQHHASLSAAPSTPTSSTTTTSTTTSTSTTTNDGGYLSYPVLNTYITSPYGMRMHPILHIWELHDGTDFHADCGTPVYAAADGTVTEEYYNAGYGNRVIIDHGYVQGVSLATSYNHLTSFVAGVGDHVSRGQLVAYSGTTGYSTGCHLHFMVYVNGLTVDPVTWL